jgi:insertion element IS1 protein InsB
MISTESKTLIQKLLLERISLRELARSVGVSMTWLQKFVNNLYRSFPCQLKVLPPSDLELDIECDKLWSFVYRM